MHPAVTSNAHDDRDTSDERGSLSAIQAAALQVAHNYPNTGGKVIEPPDGTNQSVVEYFYDANGNRQAVQDAEGKSTIYEFNKFNRLEASTPIITAMTTTTLQVYIVLKYSMWLMENLCFGDGA